MYNFTTASFTMPEADPASPATAADVLITMRSTGQFTNAWGAYVAEVFVSDGTNYGWFGIQSLTGNNQFTIRNLGYPGSATPGTTIASGATVTPTGIRGLQGVPGTPAVNGTSNIYSDPTSTSTATLTVTTIKTAPVSGGELAADNDALEIFVPINHTVIQAVLNSDYIKLQFGGTQIFPTGSFPAPANAFPLPNAGKADFHLRFVRTSATTARVYSIVSGIAAYATKTDFIDLTALDFTILNNITVQSVQATASCLVATGIFVDKIEA